MKDTVSKQLEDANDVLIPLCIAGYVESSNMLLPDMGEHGILGA